MHSPVIREAADPDSFVSRGLAVCLHRAGHEPLDPDCGFTELPGGGSYRLPPYRPADEFVLQVPRATICHPNIVEAGGVLLDANTGYTSMELIRQWGDQFPLQRTRDKAGLEVRGLRGTVEAEGICYLSALENYAAWLLGELPKVELFRLSGRPCGRFLLHGDPRPYHFDSLAAAGVPAGEVEVAPSDQVVAAANVRVASAGFVHHVPSPRTLAFLAGLQVEDDPPDSGADKIYLTRSGIANRRITNEPAIEESLRARGYRIVVPERLSFAEQAALFRRAKVIVAPFGATLVNLVFARPDAKVMIVTTKFTLEHARLLNMRGMPFYTFSRYRRDWLRIFHRRNKEDATKYTVDLPRFLQAVDRLEAGAEPAGSAGLYPGLKRLRRAAS